MKFVLVDGSGEFVGPPHVDDSELRQVLDQTFKDMQDVLLSAEELARCRSVLENLVGTTVFAQQETLGSALSASQTSDLASKLKGLSPDAARRIDADLALQDIVVQLQFLTAYAAGRNLALWLVTED